MRIAKATISIHVEWQCPFCEELNRAYMDDEYVNHCSHCHKNSILAYEEVSYQLAKKEKNKWTKSNS